ncbi:MAG: hypothetical protein CVU44_02575 [Chloroflexi bacterium HGW-Chloroflexi-6]|nr:MAG: hypothetical protein CVU44_02575 [Chloroflexi bacterium HGW-Chloroflexi-6]
MMIGVVKEKWENFFGEVRTRLDKRSDDQLTRDGIKRKEFVGILQERYGYTQEKAEAEMSAHYSGIILD